MIKAFIYITILTLNLTLCSNIVFSQSAFNNKENITNYELKSEKERAAYENKVKHKLEDFYNYLEIIGNPEVEKELREHTVVLAQKLFSEDVQIVDFVLDSTTTIALSSFLNRLMQSAKSIEFTISNIVTQSKSLDRNANYSLRVIKENESLNYELSQSFTISLLDKKLR